MKQQCARLGTFARLNHTLAKAFPRWGAEAIRSISHEDTRKRMVRKKPTEMESRAEEAKATRKRVRRPGRMHPAGPHARPELTDEEATPGTGALPDVSSNQRDVDPGTD